MNPEILKAIKRLASEVSNFADNIAFYAENEEQRDHANRLEAAADLLVEVIEKETKNEVPS